MTESARVTLKVTQPYNFCDPKQRGDWFDIVIALVQYLQSGESKVGFLNKHHPKNMLHKDVEARVEAEESKIDETRGQDIPQESAEDRTDSSTSHVVRRSTRKRPRDVEFESGRKGKRR